MSKQMYYQSKSRFNNNPFQVFVLKETEKMAFVRTQGEQKIEFWAKKSSLYTI